MTWFTEDVTTPLVVLGLVELLLAVALYQTGRAVVITAMATVAVIAAALFFTERTIVTERERVVQSVYAAADALESNDEQQLLALLGPDAIELRAMAARYMRMLKITEAAVTERPQVTINELTSPPTAEVHFMGRIKGNLKMGNAYGDTFISKIHLTLRRYEGEWKIVAFESDNPLRSTGH